MKSVPVLELHRGKPALAPVKCIRRAIGSTRVPSPWAPEGETAGHCTAWCLHRVERGHGPLPHGQACCKAYLPFNVNSALGVCWIVYLAAGSGTLLARCPVLLLLRWSIAWHNTSRSSKQNIRCKRACCPHCTSLEGGYFHLTRCQSHMDHTSTSNWCTLCALLENVF